ncbi:uncharacterized protein LOC129000658 [Macrosteles quadrilineatus]|uniref:uncharacterized protein LOC129000658 n=1 Tax=Macrosteles quadrilineatus TaxID=74068 RepID=UPI0023E23109|nr:uncharacterized protein LOC129000658 [Macrosteles quadrilineatus]
MTALVLSTIFLLFFPIVCHAAEYAVAIPYSDVILFNEPIVSLYEYETGSNDLFCAVYEFPFTLTINGVPTVKFNNIAFVHNLGAKRFVRAFANNNCDDFANNLCASGDVIEFQLSPGRVVSISKDKNERKDEGTSFTKSPWTKYSCEVLTGMDPSKTPTTCLKPRPEEILQSFANSQVTAKRDAVVLPYMDFERFNKPIVSLYDYVTESNSLFCAVYRSTFTLKIKGIPTGFNSIAFVHDLLSNQFVRAFANNNCDDFANNLYASGDVIEVQLSSGRVALLSREKNELKEAGTSFTKSPWTKYSCQLSADLNPSKTSTTCLNPRPEEILQSSANSQPPATRSAPVGGR